MSRFLLVAVLAAPLALAACSSEPATPPDAPEPAPAATEAPAAYVTSPPVEAQMEGDVQVARVEAGAMGFQPRKVTFRAGVPARLVVTRTVEDDCSSQITLPAYGVDATDLPMNTPVAIEFTPEEGRETEFVCGMGMQDMTLPRPDGGAPSGAAVAAATVGEAHAGEDETDQKVRLSFEPGTSQTTIQDTLGRAALHDYRVQAASGQTLTATLRSGGPPTILVMDDEGHSPTAIRPLDWTVNEATTQPAGWRWQGTLPHDGVYWVRVAHSGPAVNGGSWSPYALAVEIE